MALLDLFTMSVGGLAHAFAPAIAEGIQPAAFARFAKGIGGLLPDMAGRFADQLTAGRLPADVANIASAGSAVTHVLEATAAAAAPRRRRTPCTGSSIGPSRRVTAATATSGSPSFSP